jgi:hypothetical protein
VDWQQLPRPNWRGGTARLVWCGRSRRELEEMAWISGANLLEIFRRILLPLLAPVLIAA